MTRLRRWIMALRRRREGFRCPADDLGLLSFTACQLSKAKGGLSVGPHLG